MLLNSTNALKGEMADTDQPINYHLTVCFDNQKASMAMLKQFMPLTIREQTMLKMSPRI